MSEWVEVSRKKNNVIKKDIVQKSALNIISSKKPISSNKEVSKECSNKIKTNKIKINTIDTIDTIDTSVKHIFEDLYGDELEDNINIVLNDLKPQSILLNNLSRIDMEEFFYEYFDIENSVKRVEIKEEKKEHYYSDEEYY